MYNCEKLKVLFRKAQGTLKYWNRVRFRLSLIGLPALREDYAIALLIFELLHPINNPFKLFKFYCNTVKTPNGGYSHNDCMTPTLLTKCNAQREHGQGITEGKQV